jgi:AcrR family transcriptional regulator
VRKRGAMGNKSLQKKKYILETARKVFVEKGFKKVTMKDIVEACEISRGGLYLYYNNTEEIFLEVMRLESQEADDVFSDNIREDATAADILVLFLQEQKKELLRRQNTLTQAIYEFYFANEIPKKYNILKRQFDSAVKIIQKLIEAGVDNGEFYCEDSEGMSRNIMFVLEGLKISAQTIGVTAAMVDRELEFILKSLGVEEEETVIG